MCSVTIRVRCLNVLNCSEYFLMRIIEIINRMGNINTNSP